MTDRRISVSGDWFNTIAFLAQQYGKSRSQVLADLLEMSHLDGLREMYDEGDELSKDAANSKGEA